MNFLFTRFYLFLLCFWSLPWLGTAVAHPAVPSHGGDGF